jgi:hypothetical protein
MLAASISGPSAENPEHLWNLANSVRAATGPDVRFGDELPRRQHSQAGPRSPIMEAKAGG